MGRPRLKTTKQPVKLTLSPRLRADAEALAYGRNESLSSMVERLLGEEVSRRGIVMEDKRAADTPVTVMPKGAPVEYPVRKRQRRADSA